MKLKGDYAVKKSFSLSRRLFKGAEKKAHRRGFAQFSDYLQELIRKDLGQASAR